MYKSVKLQIKYFLGKVDISFKIVIEILKLN